MRAAIFEGPGKVSVGERPDPVIEQATDAVVRVVLGCVCGSDLWYYRGETEHAVGSIGHEFIGVVEAVGSEVTGVAVGDLVIAPFIVSDGTCPHCRHGATIACVQGATFGNGTIDGGQGEAVRVPLASGTLVPVPGSGHDDATLRSLLTLSDVMSTGHHAAVSAGVIPGTTAVVVGDGAVGLCGVLGAKRLGADRIIVMGRHDDRLAVARTFGATDEVRERGPEGIARVHELTGGGATRVLECVGTAQATDTAIAVCRPGGTVGHVGVPAEPVSLMDVYNRNITLRGGVAPARAYMESLLADVLAGTLDPSPVLDLTVDLDGVPEGYAAMDERRAIKALVRVA